MMSGICPTRIEGEDKTFRSMVGETGFEPATPWSQTRCATSLRHSPTALRLGILAPIRKRHEVATSKCQGCWSLTVGTSIPICFRKTDLVIRPTS
jgi:hypothetical protein